MKLKPKIKYWQTLEQIEKGWIIPTATEYGCCRCEYEKEADFTELHRDALVQELIKNKYIICGDSHQYLAIPVFEDGYLMLSMRQWREVMKEAFEICNPGLTEMPNFYMVCMCDVEENLPPITEAHKWTSRSSS